MVQIHQKKMVVHSIEVQCKIEGLTLAHLQLFDASLPALNTPINSDSINTVTFVGNIEQQQQQQQQQQLSADQQERVGAVDVRIKDQQAVDAIEKSQLEKRHTVATGESLQITVSNKRNK